MSVARDENGIAFADGRHDHGLDCRRCTVDEEDCMVGVPEPSGEPLRLVDDSARIVKVVELVHQRDLLTQTLVGYQLF